MCDKQIQGMPILRKGVGGEDMRFVALIAALVLLCGCGQVPPCTVVGGHHTWGKWTNEWAEPNPAGFMRQKRFCEHCWAYEAYVYHP